ncbi:Hypothetical protein PMT_2835 [Prochlorococcus marinus str. MIT 9313]|uniref:Uncharacterized protein n=1 Tax=Prochlorococcus marinus (strain MIT 9313) TaxID=74547 RepID=B9ESK8_PROMM|nr:Hypothetical protein PMT_2835 [Prochlorococcus marinus str. MIT 9313]
MVQAGNHLKSHLDPLHWVEQEQILTGLKSILEPEGEVYLVRLIKKEFTYKYKRH